MSRALRVSVVVFSLLMITLSLLVPSAFAAGDDIWVVSNDREVHFPGDVVLNLEVEGESDIVEVQLYYRASPSRIWRYTYPNLTPSRRVETSFNLNLSGVSYLPPGTEIEYYYSIHDSQGNALETRRETFVYVDDRFQWQTVKAGPLTIFWHNLSKGHVREVAQSVEKSLYEVSELLQVGLETPMRGIIYNSRSEARDAFPFQSRTTTQEQVFQGMAFPDRGAFVGIGLQASLIVHESAHLLLREATDSPRAKVPAWVNEGFASYVEPNAHGFSRGLPRGTSPGLMRLRHMSTVPGRPDDIRYFYRKSESVVGYLLETYSAQQFRAFIGHLNEGRSADSALTASYGFGLDALDQRWASALGERGSGGDGSGSISFAYLDTVLIAVLALVVLGVTSGGFVVRRLRKRAKGPEEWDGLTEDEWEGRP